MTKYIIDVGAVTLSVEAKNILMALKKAIPILKKEKLYLNHIWRIAEN